MELGKKLPFYPASYDTGKSISCLRQLGWVDTQHCRILETKKQNCRPIEANLIPLVEFSLPFVEKIFLLHFYPPVLK